MIGNMMGLRDSNLQPDDAKIMTKAHTFFKIVQESWITHTRKNFEYLEITKENESNMVTGGECNVFEILSELKNAVHGESYAEELMLAIKPDILCSTTTSLAEKEELTMKFSILKINNRFAKLGKTTEQLFK